MKTTERQFHTYLKASPSKTGVKGSLKVWQSDMAVSKRPAWTKRDTISSAEELPVETGKLVATMVSASDPKPPLVSSLSNSERCLACLAHWSSTPRCLAGPEACCWCPQMAAFLPATATAAGSCWARVRRMRAKEHSFSRSPSSRISICRLARSQRKIFLILKVQRKCLSLVPINSACQFPLNIK